MEMPWFLVPGPRMTCPAHKPPLLRIWVLPGMGVTDSLPDELGADLTEVQERAWNQLRRLESREKSLRFRLTWSDIHIVDMKKWAKIINQVIYLLKIIKFPGQSSQIFLIRFNPGLSEGILHCQILNRHKTKWHEQFGERIKIAFLE